MHAHVSLWLFQGQHGEQDQLGSCSSEAATAGASEEARQFLLSRLLQP